MDSPIDDSRDESYFYELILEGPSKTGMNNVAIDLAEDDAGYSIEFNQNTVWVVSECCSSEPSLFEAREIYAALGAWLKIQEEKQK